jgi:hypothetical protein
VFEITGLKAFYELFEFTSVSFFATWCFAFFVFAQWNGSYSRGTQRTLVYTHALWAAVQTVLLTFSVFSDFVLLTLLSVELFFMSSARFAKFLGAVRNVWVERLGHLIGGGAALWWAVVNPTFSWTEMALKFGSCETEFCQHAHVAAGLYWVSLALRSGLLPHNAMGLGHSVLHLVSFALPAMLLTWVSVSRIGFAMPTPLASYFTTLGLLVFTVFQIIGVSRNRLVDLMASLKTANIGLFWALLGASVLSMQSQTLFAYFWTAELVLFSALTFLAWIEEEGLDLSERSLRGLMNSQWVACVPGFVLLLALAGQPWIAAAVVYPETLAFWIQAGTGMATLYALGMFLQSAKTTHLALMMALPNGRRSIEPVRLSSESHRVVLHWLLAVVAVALGFAPFFFRFAI